MTIGKTSEEMAQSRRPKINRINLESSDLHILDISLENLEGWKGKDVLQRMPSARSVTKWDSTKSARARKEPPRRFNSLKPPPPRMMMTPTLMNLETGNPIDQG